MMICACLVVWNHSALSTSRRSVSLKRAWSPFSQGLPRGAFELILELSRNKFWAVIRTDVLRLAVLYQQPIILLVRRLFLRQRSSPHAAKLLASVIIGLVRNPRLPSGVHNTQTIVQMPVDLAQQLPHASLSEYRVRAVFHLFRDTKILAKFYRTKTLMWH